MKRVLVLPAGFNPVEFNLGRIYAVCPVASKHVFSSWHRDFQIDFTDPADYLDAVISTQAWTRLERLSKRFSKLVLIDPDGFDFPDFENAPQCPGVFIAALLSSDPILKAWGYETEKFF